MGNNNVYGEGHFITPNKVKKTENKIQQANLNVQNVFGPVQIPNKSSINPNKSITNKSQISQPLHTQNKKPQSSEYINETIVLNKRVLEQKRNNNYVVESRIMSRKVKTQIERSPINKIFDIENYTSQKYSPVKQQNKQVQESRVKVFQSRMQNKYFKIEQ